MTEAAVFLQQFTRFSAGVGLLYAIILTIFRYAVLEFDGILGSLWDIVQFILLFPAIDFFLTLDHPFDKILQIAVALVTCYNARALYIKHVVGLVPKKIDLDGKVFVITGSNTGIGYETAKSIVAMNGIVVMACRSIEKANVARQQIIDQTKCSPSKLLVLKLDLCGFDSVRKFVKEFRSKGLPLHGLINNAGVMMDERNLTQDGFEMVFTANHLSHFMLTNLLLPDLEKTNGRVVVLTSSLHKTARSFDFDDVMSVHSYSLFGTYAQSKLANLLFALELQRRLNAKGSKVTCNAVHPGVVRTEVTRNMHHLVQLGNKLAYPFMVLVQKTPEMGAYSSVFAATDPSLQGKGGLYLFHSKAAPMSKAAKDPAIATRLWALSEKFTGLVQ